MNLKQIFDEQNDQIIFHTEIEFSIKILFIILKLC